MHDSNFLNDFSSFSNMMFNFLTSMLNWLTSNILGEIILFIVIIGIFLTVISVITNNKE